MNISVGGIVGKLKKNADWAAFLITAYERYPDVGRLIEHYSNIPNWLNQIAMTVQDKTLLKWKLWNSPHLYTAAFKYSLLARLGIEVGIVPSKYKTLTEKIMKGAGFAALTLGGSGHPSCEEETMYNRVVRGARSNFASNSETAQMIRSYQG